MILFVIPARMGSVRIPRKNLRTVCGKTLIRHAIDCAEGSGLCGHICVSTDDSGIMERGAQTIIRPESMCRDNSDISAAIQHALTAMEERHNRQYSHVVTLQPAVMARSGQIISDLVRAVMDEGASGGLTMARTVPWQWKIGPSVGGANNAWSPGPYPRSQDSGIRLAEVNAVQVATRSVAMEGERWSVPLLALELPSWSVCLDIDTPEDLDTVRHFWPTAEPVMETWHGQIHRVDRVNA